jgi:hypothetical protein
MKMKTIRCFNLDDSIHSTQRVAPAATFDSGADAASKQLRDAATPPPQVKVTALTTDRLAAAQAMTLLMRLDRKLKEARADFNQDRFRRVMHARSRAVLRLQRRWKMTEPAPAIPLGDLCRQYHANIERYLRMPPTYADRRT